MTPEDAAETISIREFDARMDAVNRAVDLASASSSGEAVPLREHITAILDEQRRAMQTAEQEREKSAQALRDGLSRAISDGDGNLRDHFLQQIEHVKAAVVSSERSTDQRFDALRREILLITEASAEAIAKADASTEKRFTSVNEFREQLATIIQGFMPREVAEKETKALSDRLGAIESTTLRREEYTTRHEELERRIAVNENWRANVAGRAAGLSVVGGVVIAVLTALLTHALT